MRRRIFVIGAQVLIVLVVAALLFDLPLMIEGLVRRESFFQGKPTTYWRHQIKGRGRDFHNALATFKRGGTDGVEVLLEILQTGNDTDRQGVLALLRGMGTSAKSAAPALNVMLEDRDAAIRIQAADAIFEITGEGDELVPVLISTFQDEREPVCKEAATVLARIGPTDRGTVPALVTASQDNNPRVRMWAIATLGRLGSTAAAAAPALERACKDDNREVAASAVAALRRIRSAAPVESEPSPFSP